MELGKAPSPSASIEVLGIGPAADPPLKLLPAFPSASSSLNATETLLKFICPETSGIRASTNTCVGPVKLVSIKNPAASLMENRTGKSISTNKSTFDPGSKFKENAGPILKFVSGIKRGNDRHNVRIVVVGPDLEVEVDLARRRSDGSHKRRHNDVVDGDPPHAIVLTQNIESRWAQCIEECLLHDGGGNVVGNEPARRLPRTV